MRAKRQCVPAETLAERAAAAKARLRAWTHETRRPSDADLVRLHNKLAERYGMPRMRGPE